MTTTLGIDLGTASLGYALFEDNETESWLPQKVLISGVRIFPEGFKKTKSGEKSSNAERRTFRQHRRQLQRRSRRKKKVLNLLKKFHLLPDNPSKLSLPNYFSELDQQILKRHLTQQENSTELNSVQLAQRLAYFLRSQAVEKHIETDELGRALAHLSIRRGFLSNKKASKTDNKEEKAESELTVQRSELERILENNKETLGQHLWNTSDVKSKLRGKALTREMFIEEFNKIKQIQINNPKINLSEKNWQELYDAIFYQRPLKSQAHLRGKCSLMPQKTRCLSDRLIAQEYRIRKALLNLRFFNETKDKRELNKEELDELFQCIWSGETLNLKNCIKWLNLEKTTTWNFEKDSEDIKALKPVSIIKILEALGKTKDDNPGSLFWNSLSRAEQEDFVDKLLSFSA